MNTNELILNAISNGITLSEQSKDKIRSELDLISIDEVLGGLIQDSDLEEIVAVLDTCHAEQKGKHVLLVGEQIYPAID